MRDNNALFYLIFSLILFLMGGCATHKEQAEVGGRDPIQYNVAESQIDGAMNSNVTETESLASRIPLPDELANSNNSDILILDNVERLDNYRIGPQDLLEIRVFGVDELSQTVRVNSAGFISLPLIGEVRAAGLRPGELEAVIESKLAEDYLQDPNVNIFIKEFFSQRVTIVGAAAKQGIFALRGPTTLVQAIAMAGGLGNYALPEEVKVVRIVNGEKTVLTFDLKQIQEGNMEDPQILANDYIVIPRSDARVFLNDSLFRDVADFFNPFRFFIP